MLGWDTGPRLIRPGADEGDEVGGVDSAPSAVGGDVGDFSSGYRTR